MWTFYLQTCLDLLESSRSQHDLIQKVNAVTITLYPSSFYCYSCQSMFMWCLPRKNTSSNYFRTDNNRYTQSIIDIQYLNESPVKNVYLWVNRFRTITTGTEGFRYKVIFYYKVVKESGIHLEESNVHHPRRGWVGVKRVERAGWSGWTK